MKLVARTRIGEAQLRAQARKSAASAALNTAEGRRGKRSRTHVQAVVELGTRLKNMLSRLVR